MNFPLDDTAAFCFHSLTMFETIANSKSPNQAFSPAISGRHLLAVSIPVVVGLKV